MNIRHELEEVLESAIEREEQANRFYVSLAGRVKNKAVQEIFSELAREELGHKRLLLDLLQDPAADAKFSTDIPDYKVAESEERPAASENLSFRDAVAVAMKKEQQAVDLYRSLASSASDVDVKKLFNNLMNMELGHKTRLEKIFVDVGYPEVF
jgi:rubrerythrin